MSNKCILSFADGIYTNGLKRLERSIEKYNPEIKTLFWYDTPPKGTPDFKEVPFAFKTYAIKEAHALGYTQILWLDATEIVVAPLEPIFNYINKNGYFIQNTFSAPAGEWSADLTLKEFGISRNESMFIPEVLTSAFGLDLETEIGYKFFKILLEKTELKYPLKGTKNYDLDFSDVLKNKDMCISSDSRVRGHRHEQTLISLITYKLELKQCINRFFDLIAHAKDGKKYSEKIPTDTVLIQNRDIKSGDYLRDVTAKKSYLYGKLKLLKNIFRIIFKTNFKNKRISVL